MSDDDKVRNSYLAIDILCVLKLLDDKSEDHMKKINRIISTEDAKIIMSDRWHSTKNENIEVSVFDNFKDFDLLLNYGFNFENGTWFEFMGYLEKLLHEENALTTRIAARAYERPKSGKSAQKFYENKKHNNSMNQKHKYSLIDINNVEIGRKQMSSLFSNLKNMM